jgi:hypothetical protein
MTVGRTRLVPTKGEAEMDEQRVPDLEEMDEQEAQHFLADLYSVLSAEAEDRIRHEDYTMEWPQSGERLRGRQKMREFQEAHAGSRPPRLRRVLVREGLWVVEGIVDYSGGGEGDFVLILELRDGKVFRETRYYAEPFKASESRAQWFERMER